MNDILDVNLVEDICSDYNLNIDQFLNDNILSTFLFYLFDVILVICSFILDLAELDSNNWSSGENWETFIYSNDSNNTSSSPDIDLNVYADLKDVNHNHPVSKEIITNSGIYYYFIKYSILLNHTFIYLGFINVHLLD